MEEHDSHTSAGGLLLLVFSFTRALAPYCLGLSVLSYCIEVVGGLVC